MTPAPVGLTITLCLLRFLKRVGDTFLVHRGRINPYLRVFLGSKNNVYVQRHESNEDLVDMPLQVSDIL